MLVEYVRATVPWFVSAQREREEREEKEKKKKQQQQEKKKKEKEKNEEGKEKQEGDNKGEDKRPKKILTAKDPKLQGDAELLRQQVDDNTRVFIFMKPGVFVRRDTFV